MMAPATAAMARIATRLAASLCRRIRSLTPPSPSGSGFSQPRCSEERRFRSQLSTTRSPFAAPPSRPSSSRSRSGSPLESRGALRARLFRSPAACIRVAGIFRFHKGLHASRHVRKIRSIGERSYIESIRYPQPTGAGTVPERRTDWRAIGSPKECRSRPTGSPRFRHIGRATLP
jgi:hypothetical protein